MTRKQLEEGRYIGYRTYGYFHSYCEQMRSCEGCESRRVRFLCKIKRWIERRQTKIILRLADKEGAEE